MKAVTLDQIRMDLRITHDCDDELLQILLMASTDEALQFMGREEMPEDPAGDSIYAAIFLLVKSKYEVDKADDIPKLRASAETLLMPYRTNLGV